MRKQTKLKILTTNDKLLSYKETLLRWEANHKNYNLSVNWVELNELAVECGNTPYNLGCSACKQELAEFIIAIIKERKI